MKILYLVLFSWACLQMTSAQPASCDPSIEPAKSLAQLQYKNRGQHCEGFYRSRVSANDLSLVSFTKGPLRYPSTEAKTLKLSIPASIDQQANIRGYGIPRDLYYRMDLSLSKGESFDWDTGTVLLKNDRTKHARFIGLLGMSRESGSEVFVPVAVNLGTNQHPYVMQFVSSTRITQVKWRIVGHTQFVKVNEGRSIRRDKPIKIILPGNLKPGKYTLEIQGRDASDGITPIAHPVTFRI